MTFLQYLIAGLLMGGIYALMSTGLALMFGVMKIVNVAQGDFMMLGMYCTYFLHAVYGVHPVYGVFLIVPLFYGLGTLVHRVLLVHVSGRGTLQEMPAQVILTLGLSVILTNGVTILLGPMPRSIVTPLATTAFYEHGMLFNQARTYAGVAALGVVSAVALGVRYTALGQALRRCADEPEAARALGIDVRRIQTIACGLAIALTAAAGGLLATFWPTEPTVGAHFIILMFIAVVLGGMGSMLGSLLGGLMIGVVQSLSVLVLPLQLHNVSVLVVFLVVLSLRPHGLLGRHGRVV